MLGIIPAAGNATRFGGLYKELLPIGEGACLLDNAVRQAQQLLADEVVVVTRVRKIATHAGHIIRCFSPDANITFKLQEDNRGLWGAICTTLSRREESVLVMPDTVFQVVDFVPMADFALGLFSTEEPWRFGAVVDGQIRDKDTSLCGLHSAYGCVYWSREVARYWEEMETLQPYEDHTAAFNDAMRVFGYTTFDLGGYHDLGSWARYEEYIRGG